MLKTTVSAFYRGSRSLHAYKQYDNYYFNILQVPDVSDIIFHHLTKRNNVRKTSTQYR